MTSLRLPPEVSQGSKISRIGKRRRNRHRRRGLRFESLEPRCLLTAGTFDPTFGAAGMVRQDYGLWSGGLFNPYDNVVLAAAMDAQGRTVVAGYTKPGDGTVVPNDQTDVLLARYSADGNLDHTFGNNGFVQRDFGSGYEDRAADLVIDGQGRIVVVGTVAHSSGRRDLLLARFLSNGQLDTSFNSPSGFVRKDVNWNDPAFDYGWDMASAVALLSDGKIVVAGETDAPYYRTVCNAYNCWQEIAGSYRKMLVARFTTGGGYETARWIDFSGDSGGKADAVLVDDEDRIVVAGSVASGTATGRDFAVARLTSNLFLLLDDGFGSIINENPLVRSGRVTIDFGGGYDEAADLAVDSQGRIIVAGTSRGIFYGAPRSWIAKTRLNSNGMIDAGFIGGVSWWNDLTTFNVGTSVAIEPSTGKILVGGYTATGSTWDGRTNFSSLIARFTANGALDNTFGVGAAALADFGDEDRVNALVIQSDRNKPHYGKVIGIGDARDPFHGRFSLAAVRYVGDLPDRYESNDSRTSAKQLGQISGPRVEEHLSIHNTSDADWLQFSVDQRASLGHFVQIDFRHALGDLDMELYDAAGNLLNASWGFHDFEQISLAGLPAATYYVRVRGKLGAFSNGDYRLTLVAPRREDGYEPNDTPAQARSVSFTAAEGNRKAIEGLSIHDGDVDWFKIQTTATGGASNVVRIDHQPQHGPLQLIAYHDQGWVVAPTINLGGRQEVSLEGAPAGTYYVVVFGPGGAANPDYTLTLDVPGLPGALDAFEPNNAPQQATRLGTVAGMQVWQAPEHHLSLHNSSDVDWYRFKLTETGQRGHFAAIAFDHRLGDVDLALYRITDSNQTLVAESKTTASGEQLSLKGLAPGEYLLKVFGQGNPEYALAIFAPGPDWAETHGGNTDNNARSRAFPLGDVAGFQSWGSQGNPLSIHNAQDADWFQFTIPTGAKPVQGHAARIDFSHSQGDLTLELYDSTGTRLAASAQARDGEELSLATLAAGSYYLRVTGHNGATNPAYAVSIDAPRPLRSDPYEPNNARLSARDLGELRGARALGDAERPLSIHQGGDEDWFRFTLAERGTQAHSASILLNHFEGDLDLQLVDGSGAVLETSSGVGNVHTISLAGLAANQAYYLRVLGASAAVMNPEYYLSIRAPGAAEDWSEANNTRSTARDLRTPRGVTAFDNLSLHSLADIDWFKFSLGAGGTAGHFARIDFDDSQGDLDLRLYDQNGSLLATSATAGGFEQISLEGRAAGTYYVQIERGGQNQPANPDYRLVISAPHGASGDWAEPNDTRQTANDLRQVRGTRTWDDLSLHQSGNVDWYKFSIDRQGRADSRAAILFDHTLGDLDLALYDTNGQQLKQSATAASVEQVSLAGRPAGTYYLRVSGHSGATNPSYSLVVQAPDGDLEPDWAEPNDSRTGARDLHKVEGFAAWSGLSVHTSGNEDWFRIETIGAGLENHSVAIDFDVPVQVDANHGVLELGLYSSSGTLLDKSDQPGRRQKISFAGRSAGVYYVKVAGMNGKTNPQYTLSVNAPARLDPDQYERFGSLTNNDTRANAFDLREISGSVSVSELSIHATSDVDWFRFQLPAAGKPGHVARIDFDRSLGNLAIELRDAAGQLLRDGRLGAGDLEELSLEGLQAGTYYVRIVGIQQEAHPLYALTISTGQRPTPDWLEHYDGRADNDNPSDAFDLRVLADQAATPVRFRNWFTQHAGAYYQGGENQALGLLQLMIGQMSNQATPLALGNAFHNIRNQLMFGHGFGGIANLTPTSDVGLNILFDPSLAPWIQKGDVLFGSGFSPVFRRPLFSPMTYQHVTDISTDRFGGAQGGVWGTNWCGFGNYFSVPSGHFYQLCQLPGFGPSRPAGTGTGSSFVDSMGPPIGAAPSQRWTRPGQRIYIPPIIQGFGPPVGYWPQQYASDEVAIEKSVLIPDLSIDDSDDEDWFRIELEEAGRVGQYAGMLADRYQGGLELSLFAVKDAGQAGEQRTLLDATRGVGDEHRLSLAGLPAGEYFLRVRKTDAAGAEPLARYSLVATVPRRLESDWAEPNHNPADPQDHTAAYDLRTVEGSAEMGDLSVHDSADVDWLQFQTVATADSRHFVRIDFDHRQGDLDLTLYEVVGGQLQPIKTSETTRNTERVDLAGRPAGTYYVRVYGYQGATNPDYRLSISAPRSDGVLPDSLEPNDARAQATNLSASGLRRISGLSIHHAGDLDWFKFDLAEQGRSGHYVAIELERSAGDLAIELRDAAGQVISGRPLTDADRQRSISLAGLAPGTYHAVVGTAAGAVGGPNDYALLVDAPTQVQTAVADPWTILVYMTASDLEEFAFESINELELAAALLPPNVNIAVLYDQNPDAPYATPWVDALTGTRGTSSWGDVGRAIIQADTDLETVATRFERIGDALHSSDPALLADFATWAAGEAPAEKYALVMWNHGAGIRGFNFDDSDGSGTHRMQAADMATALAGLGQNGLRFDLIAFDACLMSMAEVGYLLGEHAEVIVGSQDVVVASGHHYPSALSILAYDPRNVDARLLGSHLVQAFENQYRDNPHGADTHAAVDASLYRGPDGLGAKLAALIAAMPDPAVDAGPWIRLREHRSLAAAFQNNPEYRDLGRFLASAAADPALPQAIRDAAAAAHGVVERMVLAQTSDRRGTGGLSIYLPAPGASVDPVYTADHFGAFFQQSGWDSFVQRFTGLTAGTDGVAADWAEPNDLPLRAHDLQRLAGHGHQFQGLTVHRSDDVDWFRFFIQATGTADDHVAVSVDDSSAGPLNLGLCDAESSACQTVTAQPGGQAAVSLQGKVAGQYLLRVQPEGSHVVPDYTITVNAPGSAGTLAGVIRGNDRQSKAWRLGPIASESVFSGLIARPQAEAWYRFDTPKNQRFDVAAGDRDRWWVQVRVAGDQPFQARLERAEGGSGTFEPVVVSGTRTLALPYATGSGAAYELMVRNEANEPVGYSLRLLPTLEADQQLGHFDWSAIGNQTAGSAFPVTITAKDGSGATVTGFTGTVNLSAWSRAGAGEVTVGTGTESWYHPLDTVWHDSRTQVIYLQSELGGATTITGLALDVTTTPGLPLNNWTIRMKHTPLSSYATPSFDATGWTVVYQADQTVGSTGWTSFVFSTPFEYNGTDNLMVDFSQNNSEWSSYGETRYTLAGSTRTVIAFSDSLYGDPLDWSGSSPTPLGSNNVPNVRLTTSALVSTPITPTVSGNFVNGVWTGNVTIGQPATGVYLRADDGSGHLGDSNTFDVAEGGPTDTTPPATGTVGALDVGQDDAGKTSYQFTIELTDNVAIDVSTLDNNDVTVTGPNNFSQNATFVQASPPGNGTPRSATYRITPPGGSWDSADNGTYAVQLNANQVLDTAGNAAAARPELESFEVSVSTETPAVTASHSVARGYPPNGGTLQVDVSVEYPTNVSLLSLLWRPELPAGWTLTSVSGTGSPEIQQGEIVFTGTLTSNPLTFSYQVSVAQGQTGTQEIGGRYEYQAGGMVNPGTAYASPHPLRVDPLLFHAADYKEPRWVIDATEVNRVLSYWRAGAYHPNPEGLDGYAPGPGESGTAPRHTADYQELHWKIDGTEANRVLGYWRAGGYHPNPAGKDGYAPGLPAEGETGLSSRGVYSAHAAESEGPADSLTHRASSPYYLAGGSVTISGQLDYEGGLLSLLWRPMLPAGWTFNITAADGTVEVVAGEIVWTGTLPPSPINVQYVVQIPSGASGPQQLRSMVETMFLGQINPTESFAAPDPIELVEEAAPPATGTVAAPDVGQTDAGKTSYRFTIELTDDVAIDVATLDDNDVTVTGPNNFDSSATYVGVSPTGNGTPRTATYQITPPGGSWDDADNGTYTIALNADQVRDTAGKAAAADASLGTFTVSMDTTPPMADVADVTPDPRATHAGTVIVNFSEDVTGVDIADFSLTHDGSAMDLAGQAVTPLSASRYAIDLSTVTGQDGSYELKLNSANSGIQDAAGNPIAEDATERWSKVAAGITIVETDGATQVDENGSSDTFTVVLDAQPGSDVVVHVTSGDPGEVTVSPATLTFTSANWNTPHTVTVTGVDDAVIDGTQTTTVTVAVDDADSDDPFDGLSRAVWVTTGDNEVNTPPAARDDGWSTPEDDPLQVDAPGVLANDFDPDPGDPIQVIDFDRASALGASVTVDENGAFHYDPTVSAELNVLAVGQTRIDTFRYSIRDASGATAGATVSITVTGLNDAPAGVRLDNESVFENSSGAIVGNLTVDDPDPTDVHEITVDDDRFEIVEGRLKLKNDNSLGRDMEPSVRLNIMAVDSAGARLSEFQTVTVTVLANSFPWQNPVNRFDVNDDGIAAPADVLMVINELNKRRIVEANGKLPKVRPASSCPPYQESDFCPYLDPTGDGFSVPGDALAIINVLNSSGANAEGERAERRWQDQVPVSAVGASSAAEAIMGRAAGGDAQRGDVAPRGAPRPAAQSGKISMSDLWTIDRVFQSLGALDADAPRRHAALGGRTERRSRTVVSDYEGWNEREAWEKVAARPSRKTAISLREMRERLAERDGYYMREKPASSPMSDVESSLEAIAQDIASVWAD